MKAVELERGEQLLWSSRANYCVGGGMVTGRLDVTDRRVVFAPRLRAGAAALAVTRKQVRRAQVEPKGGSRFSGGRKERLRLVLRDGSVHLFVVRDLGGAVKTLKR